MDENTRDSTAEEKQGDPLLIELVAQFPCLYNKQLKEYRNLNFREAAWNAIGRVVNMPPSECSKRWGQLRESFARENRRREDESRSGSGLSQRRGFSLHQDMQFLEPHYKKRRTFSNVGLVQKKNQVMHRSNTQSTVTYAPTPPDVTNDTEWRRQYMAACLATSSSNAGLSVNPATPTTPVTNTSPLIPPLDSTPAATYPPVTERPPVTSTPMLFCTDFHTTSSVENTSVIDLHPVSNTPVSVSSTTVQTPHPPMAVTCTSAMTPITHSLTTSMPISPVTTITPVSTPLQTISSLLGSDTSTPPPPLTMPTPPHTPTPSYYSASPSASISASTYASDSPICSPFSPVSEWPIDEQFDSTPNCSHIKPPSCAIPSKSNISTNRISPQQKSCISTSPSILASHSVGQPSACYYKNFKKPEKNDPIESSFLRLSSVIEDHLTNRTKAMETKIKPVASNNDEAFVSSILAELANCDDKKKIAKKAKILQVLYEK